jgi:molybdate transport repressor ModE-like protein
MDARRLAVLREVARHGSFSAAARALHLTQPAVSRHVANLEREVGLRLMERTTRGLQLTEAGRTLVSRADAIAAHLGAARAEVEALRAAEAGTLRVGSFPSAAVTLVLPTLADLHEQRPGIEVALDESPPRETVRRLRSAELDAGVVFESPEEASRPLDGLERVRLLDDPMLAAVPRSHPLAGAESVRLDDLAHEGWVTGTQPGGLIWRTCLAAGFEPRLVGRSDDAQIIQGLVATGLAVTLVSGLAAPTARPDIALLRIDPGPVARVVSALRLAGPRTPPAVAAFLELLARRAAEL